MMTKIEDQYRILPPPYESYTAPILAVRNEFEGIVYTYGNVSVSENEDGTAALNFDYNVIDNPDSANTQSEEFRQFIGDVLVNIIEHNIEDKDGGDGSSNSIEPSKE